MNFLHACALLIGNYFSDEKPRRLQTPKALSTGLRVLGCGPYQRAMEGLAAASL
jgi:hypothetical protein